MGQFSSKSSVKVWDIAPIFRGKKFCNISSLFINCTSIDITFGSLGVGYGQAIATASVVSYYTCLIALAVYYLVASCQAVLPWTVCDDSISLENTVCINAGENASQILLDYPEGYRPVGSAEQYFLQNVLKEAEDINDGIGMPDLKLAACLGVCYILLFVTLWKGVASSGKVAYFTALFPYVVLFTLLGRGVTLPGGITFWYF